MDISREDIPALRSILREEIESIRRSYPPLAEELATRLGPGRPDELAVGEALSLLSILAVPITRGDLRRTLSVIRESLVEAPSIGDVQILEPGESMPRSFAENLAETVGAEDAEILDFLRSVSDAMNRSTNRD